jgi:hypothetical protein
VCQGTRKNQDAAFAYMIDVTRVAFAASYGAGGTTARRLPAYTLVRDRTCRVVVTLASQDRRRYAEAPAGASPRLLCQRAAGTTSEHSESGENIDKINIPREELEDVMLAELQRTVVGADVREIAIFGASGLRSGATWIVASFLPGSSEAGRNLETVRHVEADLQSKYDMMLGS